MRRCPSTRAEACPTARAPAFLNSNSNNKHDLQKNLKTTSSYYFRKINKSILHKAYIFRSSHKISNKKIVSINKIRFHAVKYIIFFLQMLNKLMGNVIMHNIYNMRNFQFNGFLIIILFYFILCSNARASPLIYVYK